MSASLKRINKIATHRVKITPTIRAWLAGHPEGVGIETEEEAELMVRLLMIPEEGSRAGAFHPSGLTRCQREQLFGFYGDSKDEGYSHGAQLQNIFNDGTWRHARWQLMLTKLGILHSTEVPVNIPSRRLTGSMDGQGTDKHGEEFFFELKGTSISLAKLEKEGALPAHIFQVQAYLAASGLKEAIIIYESKMNQDWIEIIVERDEEVIAEILAILDDLNEHVDNMTLPDMLPDCKAKTGDEYANCAYRRTCEVAG